MSFKKIELNFSKMYRFYFTVIFDLSLFSTALAGTLSTAAAAVQFFFLTSVLTANFFPQLCDQLAVFRWMSV